MSWLHESTDKGDKWVPYLKNKGPAPKKSIFDWRDTLRVKPGLNGDQGKVKEPLSCELSVPWQSKLPVRDGASYQGDTPPSSRTMAFTNLPIHSYDVSSNDNSDMRVLWACACGASSCASSSWSGSTDDLEQTLTIIKSVHHIAC